MEVEFFDSFEDMQKRLQQQMKAADARVQPWQAKIKPGDYILRETEYGFPIYGHVLEQYGPDQPHLRHYRFCKCYSVACPEGEVGDVHVSTIEQILSEAEFEEAKKQGWNPEAYEDL